MRLIYARVVLKIHPLKVLISELQHYKAERLTAMKYVKLYVDDVGGSHFQDVNIKLEPMDFAPPAPIIHLSSFQPATQYAFCRFPSGWHGDWHPAPHKQIFFILSGKNKAEASDGEIRQFGPGSVLLVEDTWGKGHISRVVGGKDLIAAVVQLPYE